jgi:hypothetical protein
MIRYEYLAKLFPDFREAFPELRREDLSTWLSTFGADGWELTFVVGGDKPEWYFRRPITAPSQVPARKL